MGGASLRIGLVGAGRIAESYVRAIELEEGATLVAVADVRTEASEALSRSAGCPALPDLAALARDAYCDAVVICTPPATHPALAIEAMERGLHVLCEKPLSIDSASAKSMLEAARRNDVLFTMAAKFRYVEDVERAKALVEAGEIGDVILFENSFTARVDMAGRWNAVPEVSGGGVLIDNGTHSVDLIRHFLGPISAVQAVESRRLQGLPVEDTVQLFVRAESGAIGHVDLSWSVDKEQEHFVHIYGSEGTIRIGWRESRARRCNGEWEVIGSGYDKVVAFRRQIANFCRAARGDEPLRISSDDALASVRVVEAAYRSLGRSQWVTVADTP